MVIHTLTLTRAAAFFLACYGFGAVGQTVRAVRRFEPHRVSGIKRGEAGPGTRWEGDVVEETASIAEEETAKTHSWRDAAASRLAQLRFLELETAKTHSWLRCRYKKRPSVMTN